MGLTIAVDIHGTVADLVTPWLAAYNYDFGDKLTHDDITEFDLHKLVKPECGKHLYTYLNRWSIYAEMLPYPGALEGVNRLREKGRVVFVTHTILEAAEVNFGWLVEYGFLGEDQEADYVVCKDKSLIRADVLIDDKPETIAAFPGIGVIVDQPWNRTFDWPKELRLCGWDLDGSQWRG